MWRHAWYSLRAHPGRYFAAGVTATVGTIFLTLLCLAALTLNAVIRHSAVANLDPSGLRVTATFPLTDSDADTLLQVDGVSQVVGDSSQLLGIGRPQSQLSIALVGALAPQASAPIVNGRAPDRGGEVALSKTLAITLGVELGDPVRITESPANSSSDNADISDPEQLAVLQVVGILADPLLPDITSIPSVLVSPAMAAQFHAQVAGPAPPTYSQLFVSVSPDADASTVAAAINHHPGMSAVTTAEVAKETLLTSQTDLWRVVAAGVALAVISIVLVALMVANTLEVIAVQRTQEAGLLRTLGATRRQVRKEILAEAVILGVVSAAVGVLMGYAVGQFVLSAARISLPELSLPAQLPFSIWSTAAPLITISGVVTAVSFIPARTATSLSIPDALRADFESPREVAQRPRTVLAAVLAVIGSLALIAALALAWGSGGMPSAGIARSFPFSIGVGAGLTLVGAIAIASPVIMPPLHLWLGSLGRRILPARLRAISDIASTSLAVTPRRSVAATMAVMSGVGLVVTAATVTSTTTRSVTSTNHAEQLADVEVYSNAPNETAGRPAPLPQEKIAVIVGSEQIRVATAVASGVAWFASQDSERPMRAARISSAPPALLATITGHKRLFAELNNSTIIISQQLARSLALIENDLVWVRRADPSAPFDRPSQETDRMGLTAKISTLPGNEIFVTPKVMQQLDPSSVTAGVIALADDSQSYDARQIVSSLRRLLSEAGSEAPIWLSGAIPAQARLESVSTALTSSVTTLMVIAVIIAFVAIANTMSLSAIERRREIAILRAVGATRGQVRHLFTLESLLISGVGASLGAGLGIIGGWAATAILLGNTTVLSLAIPWRVTGFAIIFALCAAVLAGLGPTFIHAYSHPNRDLERT